MNINISTPPWLAPGKKMSEDTHKKLSDISKNWVKLFAHRHSITEIECLNIICIEMTGKKRPDMIHRVKHWFNSHRHDREVKELWGTK